jgi:tetratricopeptide (TPR) repeat protein
VVKELDARKILTRIAAAAKAGDLNQAASLSQEARQAGVEHPLPLSILAHACQSQGRFDDAIGLLGRAIELDPDANLYVRLGACLDVARRPADAIAAYDRALEIKPDLPSALDGKARLLRTEGRADEARALFEQALAADPKFLAAEMGLAHLEAEAGDWAAAKAACANVLESQPNFPEAVWLLAQAAMAEGEPRMAEARLRSLLADTRLTPFQRADAKLELGDALHAQQRWREAFDSYVGGKADLNTLYARRAAGREREAARIERIGAAIERAAVLKTKPPERAALENEARTHVFLLGFPRSGTTLLEQVLASHPDVVALEERPLLASAATDFLSEGRGLDRLAQLPAAESAQRAQEYWREVAWAGVEAKDRVFVDKQPGGAVNLALIARLFPRAKILFAVRDPRDVALSCLRQNFQMNALTYELTTLKGAAETYAAMMRLAEAARTHLPLDWLDVRHEDLVADFDGKTREICTFLDLERNPALADFAATAQARQVRTPSADQVRGPLTAANIGRWRDYREQLAPVFDALKPWVERYGYAAD